MKLTALFFVQYGKRFWHGLGDTVDANPLFDFMKPGGRGNRMFTLLVAAYEKVVELSFMSRRSDAWVLERFFDYLQLDKLEVGDEMAIVDLHAFVSGVDCFALMEDARYSAMMISPSTQPTGQKFDEATLVH
ncbi:unnamed protein product [Arabis nemorensis]|uniref:SURP motif domain-containing protein n=1 Tax=Arabis nemorensis TaxID=586526 RepID=A0A565BVN2_9BRAS|nr:unnamed protein product [Arabis nemorensis]